ncbi:hypothetical protein [Flavisolibacter ginsenosidimutans]|uniref:Lipocalin-like domain-containing protein n=1 Tax=Flavisolibacter ginsenosidimutans TaxID=661481 RepID=A0A5B8UID7_9BACT|nr:hypothetical protein [Flavisolibacter ginsenosidimutans]QEC56434.1 hypothetical protein FSB75_11195 [Flavisolibacter ginsenosidimutans]
MTRFTTFSDTKKKTFLALATLLLLQVGFSQKQHKVPPMNGNMPRIAQTAWRIFKLYKSGNAPAADNAADVLVFCRTNRFSYVPSTGIGPQGTFKVQGRLLVLTNDSDKKPAAYKMSWLPGQNILKLEEGGIIFEMEYNGETNCNG